MTVEYSCAQIRDGRRGRDRLIGRYCGTLETALQPRTTGPAAVLRFHSDRSRGGKGFTITYHAKRCTHFPSFSSADSEAFNVTCEVNASQDRNVGVVFISTGGRLV